MSFTGFVIESTLLSRARYQRERKDETVEENQIAHESTRTSRSRSLSVSPWGWFSATPLKFGGAHHDARECRQGAIASPAPEHRQIRALARAAPLRSKRNIAIRQPGLLIDPRMNARFSAGFSSLKARADTYSDRCTDVTKLSHCQDTLSVAAIKFPDIIYY